jgi:asparagine N-glycosylation enzyme membrane subunit Stt3
VSGEKGDQFATGPSGGWRLAWRWELAAVAIAIAGVLVRCVSWSYVFSDVGVLMTGTDPYYHLWRAKMLISTFPGFSFFDPFLSFPEGAPIPWPPGFDLILAAPGLLGAESTTVAGWGAVLMPLLGGLAVYLTYRLGRKIVDPACGLVAAAFMAMMNGAVQISQLGRVDHHALVAPVTVGMFLFFIRSLQSPSGFRSCLWGCGCGFMAAFSVGSWVITPPLYFLPVPMTLLALRWGVGSVQFRRAAWSCLVSAAVLVLAVVLVSADLKAKPFALYQPSWFTVALFALVPVFVLPFFYRRMAFVGFAAVAIFFVVAAAFFPQIFSPLRQALEVASGNDPSYLMARESWNIFYFGELFSFTRAIYNYTNLILLAPFVWIALLYRSMRSRDFSAPTLLGLSFSFLSVCFLMVQFRFGEFSAPAIALLFGWMLTAGARKFCLFLRNAPNRIRAIIWAVLLVVSLGVAISPLAMSLVRSLDHDPVKHQRLLMTFGRELEKRLPDVKGPRGELLYGLNTGWNEAHPLLYIIGRPIMVSSFGTPEARAGNREAFRLLLSSDEEVAYHEMLDKRIRFVVTSNFISGIVAMSRIAEVSERFLVANTTEKKYGYMVKYQPLRPLAESIYMRMFLCDGSGLNRGGYQHKPLGHHRLRLESFSTTFFGDEIVPLFKAFEVVAGARVVGTAEPGERVKLKLPLQTNTGRQFMFRSETDTAADGRFEFVVPYPTQSGESEVVSLGPYLVKVGSRILEVNVTERDVIEGLTVRLRPEGS